MMNLYLRDNVTKALRDIRDLERVVLQAAVRFGDDVFLKCQAPGLPFSPVEPLACSKVLSANVSILELAKLNAIRERECLINMYTTREMYICTTVYVPMVEQIIRTRCKDVPLKPIIIFGTIFYRPVMDIPETYISYIIITIQSNQM